MAASVAKYVAELSMEMIRIGVVINKELLPQILPIVIYRETSKWTFSKSLNNIQISLPKPLLKQKMNI